MTVTCMATCKDLVVHEKFQIYFSSEYFYDNALTLWYKEDSELIVRKQPGILPP